MPKPLSENFKQGIWHALYEFLMITMPVGIYVTLEALNSKDLTVLYTSPEWSIATIFLSFIGLNRYRNSLDVAKRTLSEPIVGIFSIISLLFIVAATVNTYFSINHETGIAIFFRLVLLSFSILKFFFLIIASFLIKTNK